MPGAEARQARNFLVFLNDDLSLASDFLGGNFDRNLAFDAVLLRLVVLGDVVSVGLTFYLSA